jgi:hypothetical protein
MAVLPGRGGARPASHASGASARGEAVRPDARPAIARPGGARRAAARAAPGRGAARGRRHARRLSGALAPTLGDADVAWAQAQLAARAKGELRPTRPGAVPACAAWSSAALVCSALAPWRTATDRLRVAGLGPFDEVRLEERLPIPHGGARRTWTPSWRRGRPSSASSPSSPSTWPGAAAAVAACLPAAGDGRRAARRVGGPLRRPRGRPLDAAAPGRGPARAPRAVPARPPRPRARVLGAADGDDLPRCSPTGRRSPRSSSASATPSRACTRCRGRGLGRVGRRAPRARRGAAPALRRGRRA